MSESSQVVPGDGAVMQRFVEPVRPVPWIGRVVGRLLPSAPPIEELGPSSLANAKAHPANAACNAAAAAREESLGSLTLSSTQIM